MTNLVTVTFSGDPRSPNCQMEGALSTLQCQALVEASLAFYREMLMVMEAKGRECRGKIALVELAQEVLGARGNIDGKTMSITPYREA